VPVLEALRARDPQRAEAAIRRHIEEPGEWIQSEHGHKRTPGRPEPNEAAV
jgi:DNA-binding GntR family transcriptional regulator